MEKEEFNQRRDLLDNIDLEEIAKGVKNGFISGLLNNEEGKNIYWKLKVNVWEDKWKSKKVVRKESKSIWKID